MDQIGSAPKNVPPDAAELSIGSFANEMVQRPSGILVLILAEDDFILNVSLHNPGNAHILSTRAFLEGLEKLGNIKDTSAVWNIILKTRSHVA